MSNRKSPNKDSRKGSKDKKNAGTSSDKDKTLPDKKGRTKDKTPIVVADPQSIQTVQYNDDGVPQAMLGNVHPSVHGAAVVFSGGHRGVQRAPSAMSLLHDTVVLTSDKFEMPSAEELLDPGSTSNSTGTASTPVENNGEGQAAEKKDLATVAKMMQTTTRHDNAKVSTVVRRCGRIFPV